MTKQEIKKAIENGESVWVVDKDENEIEELYFYKNNIYEFDKNDLFINKFWIYEFRNLFKTKAEAEHYLHHANISRIEHLPFLTWEEFLSEGGFSFTSAECFICYLYYDKVDDMIYLEKNYEIDPYGATESNFYKAYDECVRLFKEQ